MQERRRRCALGAPCNSSDANYPSFEQLWADWDCKLSPRCWHSGSGAGQLWPSELHHVCPSALNSRAWASRDPKREGSKGCDTSAGKFLKRQPACLDLRGDENDPVAGRHRGVLDLNLRKRSPSVATTESSARRIPARVCSSRSRKHHHQRKLAGAQSLKPPRRREVCPHLVGVQNKSGRGSVHSQLGLGCATKGERLEVRLPENPTSVFHVYGCEKDRGRNRAHSAPARGCRSALA